jgi:hypothetical protein
MARPRARIDQPKEETLMDTQIGRTRAAKETKSFIAIMKQSANDFIRNSRPDQKAERQIVFSLTADVLMKCHKYQGFNYLYWLNQGCGEWQRDGKPEGKDKDFYIYGPSGDQSRIMFY